MAKASASNVINWSAFARHGFETALAGLERVRSDQSDTIVRLRASKVQCEQQDLIEGMMAGRAWAEERADYRLLRRLQKSVERWPDVSDQPWERLRKLVDPSEKFTEESVLQFFFDDEYSDYPEYPSYVASFIEGALDLWRTISRAVEADDPNAADYLPQLGAYEPVARHTAADFEAVAAAALCLSPREYCGY
jgi:hypothetical protein